MNQLRIYTEHITNRLDYSCKHLFKELLGIDYILSSEKNDNAHISYSPHYASGIQIDPVGMLQETGHDEEWKKRIKFIPYKNTHICFALDNCEFGFDVFAASFFHLSRYEEYLNFFPDDHYRFTARESVLAQQEVINEPLINQWALLLKEELEKRFPELEFNPRSFEYTSTIDIDQAWKYRRKGFKRNVAGFFRDLMQGKWENFRERWPVYLHLKHDPFYNFKWQDKIHQKHSTHVKYFMLLGDRGEYDKNIQWNDHCFAELMNKLNLLEYAELGIHPSYQSNFWDKENDTDPFKAEIKRLQTVIARGVALSRQHFLMHEFPSTYTRLKDAGIKEDHTMGYSTHSGFRAGIAAPFYFYDFEKEQITDLKLVPFCLMDITPLFYMELTVDEAVSHMRKMVDKVRTVGGHFVSLWHNESLSETERWKGWRILYERMLEETAS